MELPHAVDRQSEYRRERLSSGNPAKYEARLTEIFTEIIHRPGWRLVK